MAPDASALKSARELAQARRWQQAGRSEDMLWGLAQGSGKDPYQVQVALTDHASKCSCPSRKFPCKHALGLLLMVAENAAAAPPGTPPAYVEEWRQSRAARAEKQQEKAAQKSVDKPVDPEQRARREQRRSNRVDDGIALLQQNLIDLVRSGLSAAAQQPGFWADLDRRMVDAQAPALAARVQRLRELLTAGPDRLDEAVDELGRLQVLVSAAARRGELPPPLQAGIEQALGVPMRSEDVLREPGVKDDWCVVAIDTIAQDHLLTTVTWLLGRASARWASLVQSAPAHQRGAERLPLGVALRGELVQQQTAAPLRGLFRSAPAAVAIAPPSPAPFAELLARHAAAVAAEPWRRQTPFLVAAQPAAVAANTVLCDAHGDALPWQPRGAQLPMLRAIAGGRPVPVSGVYDGRRLVVLAAADEHGWVDLAGAPA